MAGAPGQAWEEEDDEDIEDLIAATALVHGLAVATRNRKDLEKAAIEVINPFMPGAC